MKLALFETKRNVFLVELLLCFNFSCLVLWMFKEREEEILRTLNFYNFGCGVSVGNYILIN